MTLQEIEAYYLPVMGPDNADSWYMNSILGVYKEMSISMYDGDKESVGCILAYEKNLNQVRGILNAVSAHPPVRCKPRDYSVCSNCY